MIRLIAVFCCLAVLCMDANAGDMPAATILKLPLSVRQVGMGDVSLGKEDVLRSWSNPAVLASQRSKGAIALGGASLFGEEDTSVGIAGGWRTADDLVLGAVISSYGVSFPEVDAYGNPVGSSLERSSFVGGVVGGLNLLDYLDMGVTAKMVTDQVADDRESAFAFDLGAVYRMLDISAGLAVRNVGRGMHADISGESISLPTEIRLGASYCYRPRRVTAGMEYVSVSGLDGQVGVGVEWWAAQAFAGRLGMMDLASDQRRITLGLSAIYHDLGLDYAYSSHPLGATHRASVSYVFE